MPPFKKPRASQEELFAAGNRINICDLICSLPNWLYACKVSRRMQSARFFSTKMNAFIVIPSAGQMLFV